MHELSIAQNIVDIIGQYVALEQACDVRLVRVRVGALAAVVPDSLTFCFTAITAGTPLADARLHIECVPYVVFCGACNVTSEAEPGIALCPHCGSADTMMRSGTELQVVDLELDEARREGP